MMQARGHAGARTRTPSADMKTLYAEEFLPK
jgi:hypothetical protein